MSVMWTGQPATPESALDRRARAFHETNPHVMQKLIEIARDAHRKGATRIGIALLFERLRWISTVETAGDTYRLNNSYRAWYARQIMAAAPDLEGFFATRSESTDPVHAVKARTVSRAARVLQAARSIRRRAVAERPTTLF